MSSNALLRWYTSKLDSHPLKTKIITSGCIAGIGDVLCQSFSGLGMKNNADDDDVIRQHSTTSAAAFTSCYDIARTAKFTLLGATLVAPATHVWYGYLMTKIPGTNISSVIKRLAFDQGLFAPLFLTTFVSCLTVLDHGVTSYACKTTTERMMATSIIADSNNTTYSTTPEYCQIIDNIMTAPPPLTPSLHSLILTRIQNDVPQSLIVGWSIWIPSMAYMFAYVPGKYQVLFSNTVGFVWNVYLSWRTHQ